MAELTKEEILGFAKNLKDDDNVENIRSIVCEFYGENCCSNSSDPEKSCAKDECVLECKNNYLSKIFTRPQQKWTPEFELPLVREKKKLSQVVEIGLQCDSCYMLDKCPVYSANSMCSIDWQDEGGSTDPKEMIDFLIQVQKKRVARASTFEEMDGGVPDANLSSEIDRLQGMLQVKNDFSLNKFSVNISAQSQNEGGGILSQLFGGMSKTKELEENIAPVIDITQPVEFVEELLEPEKRGPKRKSKEQ